nr:T-complex protein 1 subunit eta [Ipomoea batatas]
MECRFQSKLEVLDKVYTRGIQMHSTPSGPGLQMERLLPHGFQRCHFPKTFYAFVRKIADRDIFCAGRVTEDDLQRVAAATGGPNFEERRVGNERFNIFSGCPSGKTTTIVLRGGVDQGTYVEGIKEEVVLSPGHALSFIAAGEEHRHVGHEQHTGVGCT